MRLSEARQLAKAANVQFDENGQVKPKLRQAREAKTKSSSLPYDITDMFASGYYVKEEVEQVVATLEAEDGTKKTIVTRPEIVYRSEKINAGPYIRRKENAASIPGDGRGDRTLHLSASVDSSDASDHR